MRFHKALVALLGIMAIRGLEQVEETSWVVIRLTALEYQVCRVVGELLYPMGHLALAGTSSIWLLQRVLAVTTSMEATDNSPKVTMKIQMMMTRSRRTIASKNEKTIVRTKHW